MEAMILAAGLGTRLRPLTSDRPKALVEVGGLPMLERVARRLVAAGANHLIINVHAFADQVKRFVDERDGFGVEVSVSHEKEKNLETGGGLRHAAPLFRSEESFLLHNVDVFTDLDLRALYEAHGESLAALAVRPARSQRYLLFDEADDLCGYACRDGGDEVLVRAPQGRTRRLDFLGVQVLSPRLFDLLTEEGVFSIIDVYLRLTQAGERIAPFRVADDAVWIDIGTPERLAEAKAYAARRGHC